MNTNKLVVSKVLLSLALLTISFASMLLGINQSDKAALNVKATYQLLNLSKNVQTTSFDHKDYISLYLQTKSHDTLSKVQEARQVILDNLSRMQKMRLNNPEAKVLLNGVVDIFNQLVSESGLNQPKKGGLIMIGPTISIVAEGGVGILNALLIEKLTAFDAALQKASQIQQRDAAFRVMLAQVVMLLSLIAGIGVLLLTLKALRDESSQREIAEERWRFALEGAGEGVWDWNLATDQTYYSKRWCEILELTEAEVQSSLDQWKKHIHPDDRSAVFQQVQDYLDGKSSVYISEYRVTCESGVIKWVRERGQISARTVMGRPLNMIGTLEDITARKQSEDELRVAAIVFESQEGMIVTDANNIILKVNKAFTKITGYSPEEAVGNTPAMLSSGRQNKAFYTAMWSELNDKGAWEGEIWNRRKDGIVYPEHLTITAVKDVSGNLTHYVATLTDITMSKAASEEIKNLAFFDPLTKLPNRRLMLDRLKQAVATSTRMHHYGAVLFLDLDHFKTLNDTSGHDVGDLLLQQVALRVKSCVREGDTVARIGGDEFVVLLEELDMEMPVAATQAETIAGKILVALGQPYQLANYEYLSTISIGVTLFSGHDVLMDELLKQADIAMYQAKSEGRNTIRFFDPVMQEAITQRVELERELRIAIGERQFELYYQVQVDATAHALGAEVLVRWVHPEKGLIPPNHFIPLAEETGLIIPIGEWVLEAACEQLQKWSHHASTRHLTLSVNVSARQFHQPGFAEQVEAIVGRYGINPMLLKLELTESMLLENLDAIISIMNKLKKLRIYFSLDDFGTGYSSLQYLKSLPIYQLKIDQSFVRNIAEDVSDQAIVRTVIAMAQTLNLNVIAEGVETEEQRQLLINNGCYTYQGYLFGRPLPIDVFEQSIRQHATS